MNSMLQALPCCHAVTHIGFVFELNFFLSTKHLAFIYILAAMVL